jgi:hypothetical protein
MTVEEIAKTLDISVEEVLEMQKVDKEIDKGQKHFDLPPDLEKGAKKARAVARKVGTPNTRTKTIDCQKRELINAMVELLESFADNGTVDIANIEREFSFVYKGRKFKIVMSCPRS